MGIEIILTAWLLLGQNATPKQLFLREDACRVAAALQADTVCIRALVTH